jgi:uncharacterized protein YjbJ (UPF0337 family)
MPAYPLLGRHYRDCLPTRPSHTVAVPRVRPATKGLVRAVAGSPTIGQETEEGDMALDGRSRGKARNKTRNKSQELKGQIKEATGRATGNPRLEAKGRADQTKANLKQAVEKVKDALRPRR